MFVGCRHGPKASPARQDPDTGATSPWAAYQDETGIKPEWAAEAFPDLDEDVRQSINRIKASPFIPKTDSVRGFVFDVATGKLNEVAA